MRIIKVPAVTDEDGYIACTTTSTRSNTCDSAFNTFPGINTYIKKYFKVHEGPIRLPVPGPTAIFNYTVVSFSTLFVYLPIRFAIAAIETFDIFLIFSDRNKRALAPAITFRGEDNRAPEDYGYIPQALIDWAVLDNKSPGLVSCLPGGPRIEPPDLYLRVPAPLIAEPVPDLTFSSVVTVDSNRYFNLIGCPNIEFSSLRSGN